ncbi:GntR family transcriptional regulator [Micromonospora zamorensis]
MGEQDVVGILDVSTTVVRQAILVLQTQGWVQGVHGLGLFVAER